MAKNKRRSSIPVPQQATAAAQKPGLKLSGLLHAVSNVAEVLQAPKPDWSEQLFEDLHAALMEERRDEFRAVLVDFMQIGKNASAAVERAALHASEYEAKLALLNDRNAALGSRAEALDRLGIALEQREEKCSAREPLLLKQGADLAIREENAAGGFLKERVEATRQLHIDLDALTGQRLDLQAELGRISENSRQDLEKKVGEQLQVIRDRELTLDQQAAQQDAAAARIASAERTFRRERMSSEVVEAMIRGELEAEFVATRADKDAAIAKLGQQIMRLRGDNDALNEKIDEYRDMEDVLEGRPPAIVLDELDELRRTLADKVHTIRELESARARDDSDAIRADRDRLVEELRALRPELADLQQQNQRDRMGAMEKEQWALDKRMLQKSKELLEKGLIELEGRIRSLTDDVQHQGAFPELGRMDGDNALQLAASVQSIDDLKLFTEELRDRIAASQPGNPLYFSLDDLQLFVGGLAMSQLHVFQGISGTGKTSLAKAFAEVVGGKCTDIAVQAGWRDRADLLGHYNAFEKRYYEKDALQALYRAQTPAWADRINVILLDEMNLSRPEQYFADFLSALEKEPHQRAISLMESAPPNPPRRLQDGRTILLPENVWFIGTANQDETTNELADKTHDRAFVMELRSRHKGQQFVPRKGLGRVSYSFQSLKAAFEKARNTHRKEVQLLLEFLGESELTSVLELRFGQGWGNRLERQALQFLPVVKAAGGTFEMALDHLLATRMFRAGKVTGRYDVRVEDLRAVERALIDTWSGLSSAGDPQNCLRAIEKDIKRLERGG